MEYYSSLNANSLDVDIPTLFELISAEQLNNLLAPSLRFILVHYAQRYPRYLLRLANNYDGLYSILMGFIEFFHLKKWNSSFTEKFYGLKRVQVGELKTPRAKKIVPELHEKERRLTNNQIMGSLTFLIGLPYLKEKLDLKFNKIKSKFLIKNIDIERKRIHSLKNYKEIIKFESEILFMKIYPVLKFSIIIVNLFLQIFYLFGKTNYHSIIDYLCNLRFARLTNYDYALEQISKQSKSKIITPLRPLGPSEQINKFLIEKFLNPLKNLSFTSLTYAFPVAIFALKFLEWWYASDFANQLAKKNRNLLESTLPIPIQVDVKQSINDENENENENENDNEKNSLNLESELLKVKQNKKEKDHAQENSQKHQKTFNSGPNSSLCPLCHKEVENPTAIETGFVFCYPCIHNYLRDQDQLKGGRCPITGQRLLGCEWNEVEEEWNVGGLRRLMI